MILKIIAFIIPQKNCFLTLPISQRFTLIKRVLCIKTIALSSELVTLFSKMHQQFEHIFSMKNIFYKYPYNYTFVDEISCWVIFEHLLHYSFLFYFFFHCKLGSTVHYVQKKDITITRYMYMLWMSIPQFHSLNFQFVWLRWCFVLFLLFSGARMLNVILRLLQVVWYVHLLFFISF